jgi:protein-S-isoprenylcysteine O-methyltransferase Ste14
VLPPDPKTGWRTTVFKNRGLLLVPVALALVIVGRPTAQSASIGILVALAGELLRMWAVGYSGVTTRADVVTAPVLVTAGPYSYIRNPLYAGNAITALGFWFAFCGGLTPALALLLLVLAALLVVFVYATIIPLEEAYLALTFGEPYQQYLRRVPRLWPSGKPLPPAQRQGIWRWDVILRAEVITLAFFSLMVAAVCLKLRTLG